MYVHMSQPKFIEIGSNGVQLACKRNKHTGKYSYISVYSKFVYNHRELWPMSRRTQKSKGPTVVRFLVLHFRSASMFRKGHYWYVSKKLYLSSIIFENYNIRFDVNSHNIISLILTVNSERHWHRWLMIHVQNQVGMSSENIPHSFLYTAKTCFSLH